MKSKIESKIDMSIKRRVAIIICLKVILALLTGCAGESIADVPDSVSADIDALSDTNEAAAFVEEAASIEEPEATNIEELEETNNDEPEALNIEGEWTMLRNTYSLERDGSETLEDNRQPVLQTMFVYADNTFRLELHGHGTIEGVLNHSGENEYKINSIILTNEMGEEERRGGVRWLRYDPESDLLRLTSFSSEENMYIHTHYERT